VPEPMAPPLLHNSVRIDLHLRTVSCTASLRHRAQHHRDSDGHARTADAFAQVRDRTSAPRSPLMAWPLCILVHGQGGRAPRTRTPSETYHRRLALPRRSAAAACRPPSYTPNGERGRGARRKWRGRAAQRVPGATFSLSCAWSGARHGLGGSERELLRALLRGRDGDGDGRREEAVHDEARQAPRHCAAVNEAQAGGERGEPVGRQDSVEPIREGVASVLVALP
jgi:hypothetical protein